MKGIIIGGGIAGLTVAVALKWRGIGFEVHEAAPELKPVGAGIGLGPNAIHVFRVLGIEEVVRERSVEIRRAGLYDKSGRPVRLLSYREFLRGEVVLGGAIHRAALQDVLLSRLGPGEVHLGRKYVSFTQDDSSVTAFFEDGSSATGDILIGADGIRSAVREQIHPRMPLRYSGQTCWRGISDLHLPSKFRNMLMEVWGGAARMGFIEVGRDRVYWFAVSLEPQGGRDDLATVKQKLLGMFGDFTRPCPELIEHTSADHIIRSDLFDFRPVKKWSDRRVCLIGDAAHATTPNLGQGGCQAIEDALALSICIGKYDDVETAFRRFEKARSVKTSFVTNNSWRLGKMAHYRGRLARRARDFVLRYLPAGIQRAQFHRIVDMSYLDRL